MGKGDLSANHKRDFKGTKKVVKKNISKKDLDKQQRMKRAQKLEKVTLRKAQREKEIQMKKAEKMQGKLKQKK